LLPVLEKMLASFCTSRGARQPFPRLSCSKRIWLRNCNRPRGNRTFKTMSTLLITGGAGFIGSHLVDAALAQGHNVLVLDDLSSGSVRNLAGVRSNPKFQFIPEPVENSRVLAELVDEADVIFHLAATVGVFNIIDSPVATIENNIGGTEAVLKAAAKKKKKVLVASTSEVYGKSTDTPFREDGNLTLGPTSRSRWSYAASKIVDEFLALAYWKEHKVPTVALRFFNTIGPRQTGRYGMVVPRFIKQAMEGRNLTVYGTGEQSRCFTYVQDVVTWLLTLAADDRAVGEVFNLGNPEEVTITELAKRVIAVTKSNSSIDYVSYESIYEAGFEDMDRRVPDISKVVALTGYSPTVKLDEALTRTRDWFLAESKTESAPLPAPAVLLAS
jgi:UDP-glucose 4-epimerase